MEEAKDYKKYLKGLKEATSKKLVNPRKVLGIRGLKNIQGLLVGRSALKKRKGGAMLKNPGKADLDKDGKLSGYEKKRGMAIEKNMKPMKAVVGALALGAAGALGAKKFLKRKKSATSNTGKMPVGDLVENKKKELMGKRFGGVMKRSKGGGADTGKMGEIKSKVGVASNRVRRLLKNMKGAASSKEVKALRNLVPGEAARGIGTKLAQAIKKSKANKMGGGMMNKPMGYKKGTMVMARGCKLGRNKATKIM